MSDSRSTLPDLPGRDSKLYPRFLQERFPHVVQRLVALWGKPQLEGFLEGLLAPHSRGAAGFPEEALAEIREIQAFFFSNIPSQESAMEAGIPFRDTLVLFLDFGEEEYPHTLESDFPHILQKITTLLGQSELDDYLGNLLTSARQFEHGFTEPALLEIMTIKAMHGSRYPGPGHQPVDTGASSSADVEEAAGSGEDHTASEVFDRVQRW